MHINALINLKLYIFINFVITLYHMIYGFIVENQNENNIKKKF